MREDVEKVDSSLGQEVWPWGTGPESKHQSITIGETHTLTSDLALPKTNLIYKKYNIKN